MAASWISTSAFAFGVWFAIVTTYMLVGCFDYV